MILEQVDLVEHQDHLRGVNLELVEGLLTARQLYPDALFVLAYVQEQENEVRVGEFLERGFERLYHVRRKPRDETYRIGQHHLLPRVCKTNGSRRGRQGREEAGRFLAGL